MVEVNTAVTTIISVKPSIFDTNSKRTAGYKN